MKLDRYGWLLYGSAPLVMYCPGLLCELDVRPRCTADGEKNKTKQNKRTALISVFSHSVRLPPFKQGNLRKHQSHQSQSSGYFFFKYITSQNVSRYNLIESTKCLRESRTTASAAAFFFHTLELIFASTCKFNFVRSRP